MNEIPRAEHLAWCKERALEYCDLGDVAQAWASMTSDMSKHSETSAHAGLELGNQLFFAGQLGTPGSLRRFIAGFN